MRTIICLAVLALASALPAQEVKVTYSTGAVSAKKAIADLAEKTGMKIGCAATMDKEVLILRLQDAPMSEVMKQIAAVTQGRWSLEGETQYLTTDSGARQLEANRLQKVFADRIGASLKKQQEALLKKPEKPAGGGGGEAEVPDEFFFASGDIAMTKLAIAIGATQLASVPEDGRVVFATNPTRMQRALPSSANPVIAEFIAEHNKRAAAAKQEEPAKAENEEMAAFMELFGNRLRKPQPINGPPAKALAIATRGAMFGSYTLELRLYDTAGKLLANGTTMIVADMPFNPREMMEENPEKKENPGKEIQLSPLSKEIYQAGNSLGFRQGAASLKFSKELLDAMRDPVSRDPLSFVHSEALLAIASQRKAQLVANLPDAVMSFLANLNDKGNLTDVSYLADIQGEDEAVVREADGWMIVMPAKGNQARKQRTDRMALRSLIRTAEAKGTLGLDDIAAYAVANESPMDGAPAAMTYVLLFAPSVLQQGMMGQVDWELLRLYGLLDPTQRQALRENRRLTFSSLSPGQQSQLTKMLFGPEGRLTLDTPRGPQQPKQDPLTEMIMMQVERFGGGGGQDFRTEPTEIMPNGLPSQGYVQVSFTSEPVGQPQTMSTDLGRGITLGPMELGLFKFFSEDPNMSQMGGMMPTIDDLKVGTRSVYNFSFVVAPMVAQKGILNDDSIAKDAPTYKISNLPADFQSRIEEMSALMKNNPIWKMIGSMGMGRRTPPPND